MRFVIDADIAHGVSERELDYDPYPTTCRNILRSIRSNFHKLVVTPKIADELRRHGSQFFRIWYFSMVNENKVTFITDFNNENLRAQIRSTINTIYINPDQQVAIWNIIEKDIHLVEAALITDNIILSNDRQSRDNIHRVIIHPTFEMNLSCILWIRPNFIGVILWIENGADVESIDTTWKLTS
jgi:hypothetical protein